MVHFTGWLVVSYEVLPSEVLGNKYNLRSSPLLEDIIYVKRDMLSPDGLASGSNKEKKDFPITASVAFLPDKR